MSTVVALAVVALAATDATAARVKFCGQVLSTTKTTSVLCDDATAVHSLSELAAFKGLTNVFLTGLQGVDLTPLASLDHLAFVTLNESKVDLSPLAGHAKLRALTLDESEISGLETLATLPSLTTLSMWGTSADLSVLAKVPTLTRLNLSNAKTKKFTFLKRLSKLESVELIGTSFHDIASLPASLTEVGVQRTSVTTLAGIERMKGLTHLNLGETKVSDLSPLQSLSLTALTAKDTPISDLKALANSATTLVSLDVARTKVHETAVIVTLKRLQYLTLDDTPIAADKKKTRVIRRALPKAELQVPVTGACIDCGD